MHHPIYQLFTCHHLQHREVLPAAYWLMVPPNGMFIIVITVIATIVNTFHRLHLHRLQQPRNLPMDMKLTWIITPNMAIMDK